METKKRNLLSIRHKNRLNKILELSGELYTLCQLEQSWYVKTFEPSDSDYLNKSKSLFFCLKYLVHDAKINALTSHESAKKYVSKLSDFVNK